MKLLITRLFCFSRGFHEARWKIVAKKILSFVILVIFSFTQFLFAAPPACYSVKVDDCYGKIAQRYKGKSEKTIIYIQDAHSSYDAQKNTSEIVKELYEKIFEKKKPLIGVEGAIGELDLSMFKAIPSSAIRDKVGSYYVKEGVFTGTELAAISSDSDMRLFGAEEKNLFKENFRAYFAVAKRGDDIEAGLAELEGYLDMLKEVGFSEKLREFDKLAAKYEDDNSLLREFIGVLYQSIDENDVDILKYVNLLQFKEVFIYASSIDFDLLDGEINDLAETLEYHYKEKNMFDRYEEVVRKYKEYKDGVIARKDVAGYLYASAMKDGLIYNQFPNLTRAIAYWRKYSMINISYVMKEAVDAGYEIRRKLSKSQLERDIVELEFKLYVLKKMLRLEAFRDDVSKYLDNESEYEIDTFVSELKNVGSKAGVMGNIKIDKSDFSDILKFVKEYYIAAQKRDRALIDKVLNEMDREEKDIAVLVAGGYHADGLLNLMRERAVSYVSVVPNITDMKNVVNYNNRMLGGLGKLSPFLGSHFRPSRFNALVRELYGDDYMLLELLPEFNGRAVMELLGDKENLAKLLALSDEDYGFLRDAIVSLLGRKGLKLFDVENSLLSNKILEGITANGRELFSEVDMFGDTFDFNLSGVEPDSGKVPELMLLAGELMGLARKDSFGLFSDFKGENGKIRIVSDELYQSRYAVNDGVIYLPYGRLLRALDDYKYYAEARIKLFHELWHESDAVNMEEKRILYNLYPQLKEYDIWENERVYFEELYLTFFNRMEFFRRGIIPENAKRYISEESYAAIKDAYDNIEQKSVEEGITSMVDMDGFTLINMGSFYLRNNEIYNELYNAALMMSIDDVNKSRIAGESRIKIDKADEIADFISEMESYRLSFSLGGEWRKINNEIISRANTKLDFYKKNIPPFKVAISKGITENEELLGALKIVFDNEEMKRNGIEIEYKDGVDSNDPELRDGKFHILLKLDAEQIVFDSKKTKAFAFKSGNGYGEITIFHSILLMLLNKYFQSGGKPLSDGLYPDIFNYKDGIYTLSESVMEKLDSELVEAVKTTAFRMAA